MKLKDVIKKPIITEKSTQEAASGKYTLQVDKRATKKEVGRAVEEVFGVKVRKVKTIIVKGKKKRIGRRRREVAQPDWKKAVVQLAEGNKIDLFETSE